LRSTRIVIRHGERSSARTDNSRSEEDADRAVGPGASTEGQLLVWVKSPEANNAPITSGAVPELTSFACSTELEVPWSAVEVERGRVRVVELTLGGGEKSCSIESYSKGGRGNIVCTRAGRLIADPRRGEDDTDVQAAPAARVEPQVFVCA